MMPACTAYRAYRPLKSRRAALATTATLAIAIALANPKPAHAQFNGTINPTGTTGIDPSSTSGSIIVTGPTATVNWTPDNTGTGTITFLADGSVANFYGPGSDYTVLNRIVPTDPSRSILIDGTVNSYLGGTSGSGTGGNIWFYSPGGIVIGANALFDVGGLLLTSLTIANTWENDPTSLTFTRGPNDGGAIIIDPSAPNKGINASNYIAIVAPRIEQHGDIRTGGTAALIAGDAVTLTMSDGLFNIQVTSGTDDLNGIIHTGSTTGTVTGDRIYMVAVPKTQALNMLLSGDIGFDANTVTQTLTGEIILSAGHSINDLGPNIVPTNVSTSNGSITIGGIQGAATFKSDVAALATGAINVTASEGNISFAGDAFLSSLRAPGLGSVTIVANDDNEGQVAHSVSVGGDLLMSAQDSGTGSSVTIQAWGGGDVTVAGDTTLAADRANDLTVGTVLVDSRDSGSTIALDGLITVQAFDVASGNNGAHTQGGNVDFIAVNNGSITTGNLVIGVHAIGGNNGDGSGGSARGGDIEIRAVSGGTITTGAILANANATGGNATLGGSGGEAFGGDVLVESGEGTVTINGGLTADATGTGGTGGNGFIDSGGDAYGGDLEVFSSGSTGGVTVKGETKLTADGKAGDGASGGYGQGGTASIIAFGAAITLEGKATLSADGWGGDATRGNLGSSEDPGGQGGSGYGGLVEIGAEVGEGGVGDIFGVDADLHADGYGGAGGNGNGDGTVAGNGGDGVGGLDDGERSAGAYVIADADGATVTLGTVTMSSSGTGGAGGNGGTGQASTLR